MKKWTHREWMACGVLLFSVSGLLWWLTLSSTQHGLVIDQVYVLGNGEGSFAYSRISPNGRLLAYTSLRFDGPDGTAKYTVVVDLEDGKKIFEEKGLDGYWSPNGRELIFLDQSESDDSVSILDTYTGRVKRDVAPPALGDYFSWGIDGGRNIIATNKNNYYYFEDGKAVLPASHIVPCGWSGAADGPFISKDGRRMAGFEGRAIVVRNLDDCEDIIQTGMEGGKADFSYDGRYIAFHAPKAADPGYEIKVVDLAARTVRTIAGLPGSSFYPSWTIDARLSFRYDAADFRGFVIASNFMSEPAEPLPVGAGMAAHRGTVSWNDVFLGGEVRTAENRLVLVWAPWCTHCSDAFREVQEAAELWRSTGGKVSLFAAPEPNSPSDDVAKMRRVDGITAPALRMKRGGVSLAGAANQLPTVLLFIGDRLVDRRLGTQTSEALVEWLQERGGAGSHVGTGSIR